MSIATKLSTVAVNEQLIAEKVTGLENDVANINLAFAEKGVDVVNKDYDTALDDISKISLEEFNSKYFVDTDGSRGLALFSGKAWNNDTIYPPRMTFRAERADNMFYQCGFNGDIAQRFEECGFVLDTSKSRYFMGFCQNSYGITRLPAIDMSNAVETYTGYCVDFSSYNLHTIDKIIVSENTKSFKATTFGGKLQNITFEGTLNVSISFQKSPLLTNASVDSIINALKDLTGQTALTITFHATVGANLTEEKKAIITAKNWTLVY